MDERHYQAWKTLLDGRQLPAAMVDLDAVDHNIAMLLERLGPRTTTLRVASKSVRVPWLLRYLLDHGEGRIAGLMTFSASETAFLAEHGFDDLLLAYPVGRESDARLLADLAAGGTRVWVAADSEDHVRLLGKAARARGCTLPICMDVDMSWRPLGGRAHLGVRRSPIRHADTARTLARKIAEEQGLVLTAVLAYEAQVAGIRDSNPGSRHLDPIRQFIKRRSQPAVRDLRKSVVDALRKDGHDIQVVNGGGTGSIDSTCADPSVTEATAGSGFLCPHLFDGYTGLPLAPAAFFALAVVRCSDPEFVTCSGGGYVASGGAGPDRLPLVHSPPGVQTLGMEGFGEVQTPLRLGRDAPSLGIGDPVVCRHAKAGELAERFDSYHLIRGDAFVEAVPTYRGLSACFL